MKCFSNSFQCYNYVSSSLGVPHISPSNITRTSGNVRFKSSTAAWLSRQRADHFLKARAESNYRSRSAFKLVQINEQYKLFPPRHTRGNATEERKCIVVDLGCAPGGWTQASLELLGFSRNNMSEESDEDEQSHLPQVVGVDLLPTEPVLGARFLQGNFLDEEVQRELRRVILGYDQMEEQPGTIRQETQGGVADIIISDMAPNLSGNRVADIEAGLELCRSVLAFAKTNLRQVGANSKGFGGSLVIKHFAAPELTRFREQELAPLFSQKIKYTKPEASRSRSSEAYFVCQGFKGCN